MEGGFHQPYRRMQENLSLLCEFYGRKAVFTLHKLVESCAITRNERRNNNGAYLHKSIDKRRLRGHIPRPLNCP